MNSTREQKHSSPCKSDEQATKLEREWQAFAGLVDDKLLKAPKQLRISTASDSSCSDQSHLSSTKKLNENLKTFPSAIPKDITREITNYRSSRLSDSLKNQLSHGRRRSYSSSSSDYSSSSIESRSHKSSKKNRSRKRSRNSSEDRYRVNKYHDNKEQYRYRHSERRSKYDHRSRSRDMRHHRSEEDRFGRYRRRSSSRDDSRHRKHSGHSYSDRYRHRRSRSKSIDKYELKEKTMKKLMQLASDNQLDLTKIPLADVMKTIVVPREYRNNQQQSMRYQMGQLTERIEQLTGVKIPSFYCTGAVNPLVYAEQMRKRKLLWSGKSNESTSTAKVGIAMTEGQDDKTAEKFRKLLGIRDQLGSEKEHEESDAIIQRQTEAFQAFDREYELARLTTHTHRGTGLGFLSTPTTYQCDLTNRSTQKAIKSTFQSSKPNLRLNLDRGQ